MTMADGIRGLVPGVDEPRADPATPRLRAFFWTHLLAGAANEITTLVVIDTVRNDVLAVLNRDGGPLDPAAEAAVRRSLKDNADLLGGCYAALADSF